MRVHPNTASAIHNVYPYDDVKGHRGAIYQSVVIRARAHGVEESDEAD